MASFDVQPPSINPPDWTRTFKAVPQPESDKSLGMTLSTLGGGIESAAELGGQIQKDVIGEKVRSGVEGLRNPFTQVLAGIRNQQLAGVAPTAGDATAAAAGTLAAESAAPVPAGLQQGLDRAKSIGIAMSQNSGSDATTNNLYTLYTGALNSLAKKLRAQYPGSIDQIDAQISKISGVNPANAFYESLIKGIDQNMANSKSVVDKDHAFIDKYIDTIPGMDLMRKKYDRGDANSQDLRSFVAQESALKISQQAAEAERAALKSRGALTAERAKKDFIEESGKVVDRAFQVQREATNTKTPKEIVDYFNGQADGTVPMLGEVEQRNWLTNLAAQRDMAAAQLRAIALRIPRDQQGNIIGESYAQSVGGLHNLKDEIAQNLSIYDNVIQRVKDKDYMGVYYVLNQNTAIQNKALNVLFGDPDVGEQTARIQAIATAVGPQIGPILLADAIVGGLDHKYTAYVGGVKEHALSQLDPANPTTMGDVFDDARSKKIADPGVYKSFVNIAKIITNPEVKDQGKINAATFAFSNKPNNLNSLNKFPNPEDRQTAFMTMTDPAVTDFMAKLPQKTQTEYRTWAEKTWGGTIARDAITDLTKIKDQTYLKSYHISWNTDTHEFNVINRDNTPLTDIQQSYARPITEVTNKINEGLRNLAHIEKSAGGDVNAYLVNVLTKSGFDFKNNVEGVPTKMMDALLNANRKPGQPPHSSTVKPPVSE